VEELEVDGHWSELESFELLDSNNHRIRAKTRMLHTCGRESHLLHPALAVAGRCVEDRRGFRINMLTAHQQAKGHLGAIVVDDRFVDHSRAA